MRVSTRSPPSPPPSRALESLFENAAFYFEVLDCSLPEFASIRQYFASCTPCQDSGSITAGLGFLLAGCTKLQLLKLQGCKQLSDKIGKKRHEYIEDPE